jgi:hypothetical protein
MGELGCGHGLAPLRSGFFLRAESGPIPASSGRVVLPPSCRGWGLSVLDQGPLSRAVRAAAGEPDGSAPLVPDRFGSSSLRPMSGHQPIDGDPAPGAELARRYAGELGGVHAAPLSVGVDVAGPIVVHGSDGSLGFQGLKCGPGRSGPIPSSSRRETRRVRWARGRGRGSLSAPRTAIGGSCAGGLSNPTIGPGASLTVGGSAWNWSVVKEFMSATMTVGAHRSPHQMAHNRRKFEKSRSAAKVPGRRPADSG